MKKYAGKPNRKQPVEPLFPHTCIYRTHCPHCGAEVDYTLEMQYHQKLICLSCGKNVPNPLYDPAGPHNVRRRARRDFGWFITAMALLALLWIALSYIYRDYPPKAKPHITIDRDEWFDNPRDYRKNPDSMPWRSR